MEKVALAGGTGTFRRPILNALIKAGFDVTVLTRSSSTASFNPDLKIRLVKIDYDLPSLTQALRGQHALVSAVGVAGIPDQAVMIDAAEAAGVTRFIISEFGNAPHQARLPALDHMRANRVKILEYLKNKTAASQTLTWSAIAIGPPIDMAIPRFPEAFGFDVSKKKAGIYDSGNEPFTATTLTGIGQAVAGTLANPKETANKFLCVKSVQTTQNEILKAFESATGTKWDVAYQKSEDTLIAAKLKLAARNGGVADLVAVQIFQEGAGRSIVTKESNDSALLGVEEESIQSIVELILTGSGI